MWQNSWGRLWMMRRVVRWCKRKRWAIDKHRRGGDTGKSALLRPFFPFFFLENSSCEVITGFFLRGLMGLEYVTKNWKGMGFLFLFFSFFLSFFFLAVLT